MFGLALLAAIRWSELSRLTPVGLAVISVSYLLALIHLPSTARSSSASCSRSAGPALPRGGILEVVLVGAMVGYAITIRPYWGIVVVLYVVGRILLPRVRGLVPVLIFVVVSYGLPAARVQPDPGRGAFVLAGGRQRPCGPTSTSRSALLIVDFLPDQVGLQWLNAFLVFLSLLFPWPLILGGSPTYLVMSVVIGFLWGLVAWSILHIQRERAADRSVGTRTRRGQHRATGPCERS